MQGPAKLPKSVAAAESYAPSFRILGAGAMAERIRSYPWRDTPLGPIELWPEILVIHVNLILNSPLAHAIFWGPELIFIGNDATAGIRNRSHAETLGTPAASIWGKNWPLAQHHFEAVLATGTACRHESVLSVLPYEDETLAAFIDYSLSPIYDHGSVVGIFRTLEDTTESVHAMRALAETNERLRMALSAGNGFGVWDADLQSGIVFCDEVIASIYGIEPQVASAGVTREIFDRRLHPNDIAVMDDAVLACILTGVPYTVEFRTSRDDGSWMTVRTMGRCIYDANGHAKRITGLTTVLEDKQVEAAAIPGPITDFFTKAEWELLPLHVRSFVAATLYFVADEPAEISVRVLPGPEATQIVIGASPNDLGKLIGKQGRTVRALRTLLLAINKTSTHRYSIDIQDGRRLSA